MCFFLVYNCNYTLNLLNYENIMLSHSIYSFNKTLLSSNYISTLWISHVLIEEADNKSNK